MIEMVVGLISGFAIVFFCGVALGVALGRKEKE